MVLVGGIGEHPLMRFPREYKLIWTVKDWGFLNVFSHFISTSEELYVYVTTFALFTKYRETEEPVNESEKIVEVEKPAGQEEVGEANKENPVNEPEEKEPEDKVHILFVYFTHLSSIIYNFPIAFWWRSWKELFFILLKLGLNCCWIRVNSCEQ